MIQMILIKLKFTYTLDLFTWSCEFKFFFDNNKGILLSHLVIGFIDL